MTASRSSRRTTRSSSALGRLAVLTLAAGAVSACGTLGVGSVSEPEAPDAAPPPDAATPAPPPGPTTGTSYFAGGDVGVTVTLPDGWEVWEVFVVKRDAHATIGLAFFDVVNIYSDPCRWVLFDPPVGPSVDDLVAGFATSTVLEVGEARDVTVDGYPGKHFAVTVPDIDLEDCTLRKFGLWKEDGPDLGTGDGPNLYAQGPRQQLDMWVLDVDGTRLVVGAGSFPDTPPEDVAAMQEMVSTLQIG